MKQEFEWIPVTKRFPETDDYILLNFENYSLPEIGRYDGNEKDGYAFYCGDDDKSCVSWGLFVNAWAKLPERYNEERSNA